VLTRAGLSDEEISHIMVHNPASFLAFGEVVS
jgi:predicted metal-dependent phosphotriesterase family hydrolase